MYSLQMNGTDSEQGRCPIMQVMFRKFNIQRQGLTQTCDLTTMIVVFLYSCKQFLVIIYGLCTIFPQNVLYRIQKGLCSRRRYFVQAENYWKTKHVSSYNIIYDLTNTVGSLNFLGNTLLLSRRVKWDKIPHNLRWTQPEGLWCTVFVSQINGWIFFRKLGFRKSVSERQKHNFRDNFN